MMLIKDKKEVNIASNYFEYKTVKYKITTGKYKKKRKIIAMYNINNGEVDILDCNCSIHPTQRKVKKWWKSLFFYILDITLHNCSIIYYFSNKYHPNKSNSKGLNFKILLMEEMIGHFK